MIFRTIAVATGLLLSAGLTTAQAMDTVRIAGWSKPISEITNILAEPDKGFFKAKNIEMKYVPGAGGGSAIRNMLSGAADVAFTDPASFYQALDKGEKLVAIYNIYPQNVFNVVVSAEVECFEPAQGTPDWCFVHTDGHYVERTALCGDVGRYALTQNAFFQRNPVQGVAGFSFVSRRKLLHFNHVTVVNGRDGQLFCLSSRKGNQGAGHEGSGSHLFHGYPPKE